MNSLQLELDSINSQLELLTYRKNQLDSIMSEYSDVVSRVKSLVDSMNDAMVEPSNLLLEIEGIIFNVQPELTPIENLIKEQSEPTPEELPTEEPTTEEQPTAEPEYFNFDLRLFPKAEKQEPDTVEPEAPKLNALGLPIQTEAEPESKPEQSTKRYPNNIYWDNESSVRVFIPKKRRYKLELEAIASDCIEQGHSSKYEIVECDGDWLVMFSQVTSESSVQGINDNFYPQHTDGETTPEQNPEPVKLMACVPTVATSKPELTQLNDQAYRRNDTLLIGFSNKRLMIAWAKWFNESFNGAVFVKDDENLDGFKHCLSVLWYGSDISTNWERLTKLNYAFKPDEQPTGINLDDVREVIQKLKDNGLKFISKGELLAHHLNSLKASDLEEYLDKLVEEGLIALGNKSIDLLPTKTQENEPDSPTFEYTEIDSKTTKIYNNGMLLGIAKNCGTHWESPQFSGQTFPNRRDVVAALWKLVNQF